MSRRSLTARGIAPIETLRVQRERRRVRLPATLALILTGCVGPILLIPTFVLLAAALDYLLHAVDFFNATWSTAARALSGAGCLLGSAVCTILAVVFGLLLLERCYEMLHWGKIAAHDPWCECGYDLTGNVSGICPECGTPIGLPAH